MDTFLPSGNICLLWKRSKWSHRASRHQRLPLALRECDFVCKNLITSPGRLILVNVDQHLKQNPNEVDRSPEKIRIEREKILRNESAEEIWGQSIHEHPRPLSPDLGPLPVCSSCFYSVNFPATPPWADGDLRQLYNEDCVCCLNDRPVYTSYKVPPHPSSPHQAHIQTTRRSNKFCRHLFRGSFPTLTREPDTLREKRRSNIRYWARRACSTLLLHNDLHFYHISRDVRCYVI